MSFSKRKSIIALAALCAASAHAQIQWSPTEHLVNNIAGSIGGSDWYAFNSNATVQPSNVYNSITANQRVLFETKLNTTSAYGGMGFDWTSGTYKDISASGGVCLTYRSARAFRLNLVQYNSPSDDHYGYLMPAKNAYTSTYIPFASLAREGWDKTTTFSFNSKSQKGFNIQFKNGINGSTKDSTNTIEVVQVGLGDVCNATNTPVAGMAATAATPFFDSKTTVPASAQNTFGGEFVTYTDATSAISPTAGNSAAMTTWMGTHTAVGFSTTLAATTGNPYPAVGMRMAWRPADASTDISAQSGLCITYKATNAVRLNLEQAAMNHTNYYGAALPAQTRFTARDLDFTVFQQEAGWAYSTALDLQRQIALRFEYKNNASTANTLEVLQVGFKGQCSNATFAPVLLAPYDVKVVKTLNEGDSLVIPLSSIFQDRDDPTLTYEISNTDATKLTAAVVGTNLVFKPKANVDGVSTVDVLATDADKQFVLATFEITVVNQDLAPKAVADAYSTNEDVALIVSDIAKGILVNDYDPDGSTASIKSHTDPSHGTVVLASNGTFTYTPTANYNGSDTFQYTIEDPTGKTATGTVTITVRPVNDPPTVTGTIADWNDLAEDFTSLEIVKVLKTNVAFSDPDGDALTIGVSTNGLISAALSTTTTEYQIRLTPVADKYGDATVTLYAKDAAGDSVGVLFHINITPVIDPPTPVADSYSGTEDITLAVSSDKGLLANDKNPDKVSMEASIVTPPLHGTLALDGSGAFTFKPNADWSGTDQFTYKLRDSQGDFAGTATVTLTFAAANDGPVLAAGATIADIDTVEDFTTALRVSLKDLFIDPEGDAITWIALSDAKVTTVISAKTSELVIGSVADSNGAVRVRVTATDGKLASSDTLEFYVHLRPTNDIPKVGKGIADQTIGLDIGMLAIPLAGAFIDPDGDSLTYKVTPPDGVTEEVRNDTLYLDASAATEGEFSVRIIANDGVANRSLTFKLTITATTRILVHPSANYDQWLTSHAHGYAEVLGIDGRVVARIALPTTQASVKALLQQQPQGTYQLRIGNVAHPMVR